MTENTEKLEILEKSEDFDENFVERMGKLIVSPKPLTSVAKAFRRPMAGAPKLIDEGRMEAVYRLDATVYGAINLIAEMALAYGYYFEGKEKTVKKLKEWEEFISLKKVMEYIIKNALIFGNAYVEKIIDDKLTGKSWGIKELKIVHPAIMFVESTITGDVKFYIQRVDGKTFSRREGTTYKHLVSTIGEKNMIKLQRWQVAHFKWNNYTNIDYGNSPIDVIIDYANIKLGMIEDTSLMLNKVANPVRAWLVGMEGKPVSKNAIMDFKKLLSAQVEDLEMVVPYYAKPEDISLSSQVVEMDTYIDIMNDEILKSLNVPSIIFGGLRSSSSNSTADIQLESFVRVLKSIQKDLSDFVRREFFTHLIFGEIDPIDLTPDQWSKVPKLRWREIEKVADLRLRMESLVKNGIIGLSEAREVIGFKPAYDIDDMNPQNLLFLAKVESELKKAETMDKEPQNSQNSQNSQNPQNKNNNEKKNKN